MLDLAYLARLEWLIHSTSRFKETEYDAMQRAADGAAAIAMVKQRRREANKGPQEAVGQDRPRSL